MTQTDTSLAINLAGIPLTSPVVLLSGCVGFGEELTHLDGFDFQKIGAICLKGTTLEARHGNPPPRLAETPSGLLNAIGLQNPGARFVIDHILPRLHNLPTQFIANIAGSTIEEYAEVARLFDNSPVAAIEINISCPNVKEGGAAFGSDPNTAHQVVAAVRKVTQKPILTKLSPNVTDITQIARAVLEAGTDAFSAINTLMGMAVDSHTQKPLLGNIQGGLSGPAIKPIALLKIWQLRQIAIPHNISILGQGGIQSTEDAIEFLLVGATAIGVGTALFDNPLITEELHSGLLKYLAKHNLSNVNLLTGQLKI